MLAAANAPLERVPCKCDAATRLQLSTEDNGSGGDCCVHVAFHLTRRAAGSHRRGGSLHRQARNAPQAAAGQRGLQGGNAACALSCSRPDNSPCASCSRFYSLLNCATANTMRCLGKPCHPETQQGCGERRATTSCIDRCECCCRRDVLHHRNRRCAACTEGCPRRAS
jgi:hypothetical protein